MKLQLHVAAALLTFLSIVVPDSVSGATYTYNGPEFGQENSGVLSGGSLRLADKTTWVDAVFTKGAATFDQGVVIYIDSVAGGFANTSTFADTQNDFTKLVSGYSSGRSTANFATGFQGDYAIALLPGNSKGMLFSLSSGGSQSLGLVREFTFVSGFGGNNNAYSFGFNYSDIGLPDGANNSFKLETTYLSPLGWRYLQSLESITGTEGYNPITFNNYDVFGVTPVPEMTNASLSIFGGIVALVGLARGLRRARKNNCRRG